MPDTMEVHSITYGVFLEYLGGTADRVSCGILWYIVVHILVHSMVYYSISIYSGILYFV